MVQANEWANQRHKRVSSNADAIAQRIAIGLQICSNIYLTFGMQPIRVYNSLLSLVRLLFCLFHCCAVICQLHIIWPRIYYRASKIRSHFFLPHKKICINICFSSLSSASSFLHAKYMFNDTFRTCILSTENINQKNTFYFNIERERTTLLYTLIHSYEWTVQNVNVLYVMWMLVFIVVLIRFHTNKRI